ncbi:imm11 family protein [Pseudochrobactrum asaccharolyticum]|uniref:imm11 family protein n=1 Tax=Pseudochrobactrum asaccharolyticum TaxID=354351 RepID=UPI0040412084
MVRGGTAVSQAFKDAVELIEPGVHQFFPVEILLKDGTLYKDPIYFLNIATRVESINPELGGFNRSFNPKTPDRFYWSAASGKAEFLAVYKDRIAGRALWKDNRFGGIYDFASDALLEQLRKTAPNGWDIKDYFQEI